jgi:hypothetical protein
LLQTECLVLLQMLCDYKPSLRSDLGLNEDIMSVGDSVACVEIMWRGELQRRFFHVPKICSDLAKSSKDNLVENVDRSNLESKLQDFVFRARDLYREVKHQQVLKEWKVSGIFSRSNQNSATWIAFFLAITINFLLLWYYTSTRTGKPTLPATVRIAVRGLNIFQLVFAVFTLILFIVVRVPVKYQSLLAKGSSVASAVFQTATDGLTMYYFVYLIFCLLAINYSDTFVTFLLLDIVVKNSTTRDVLNAVIYPRKQLGMTLVLGLFVMYIFAFLIVSAVLILVSCVILMFFMQFWYYRHDMDGADVEHDCETLYKCLKVTMSYGVRMPGGIGDQMTHTLVGRYILDLMFFLIVLIVLLNVIFGIIIDTFGSLRAEKLERQRNTTDTCFTCGIDKQVFDRASNTPNGFKTHIKMDHNMWNYMYFIFYVWEQDKDDDDGLEQYVRRSIAMNDIAWFPMNKAMRLEMASSPEEDLRRAVKQDIVRVENTLNFRLSQIQGDFGDSLEKIVASLQSQSKADDASSVKGDGASVATDDASVASRRARSARSSSEPIRKKKSKMKRQQSCDSVEEGEGNEDDVSLVSELAELSFDAYNRDNAESHRLSLQINSLEGLPQLIQSSDLSKMACRVVSDTGMHDVSYSGLSGETMMMKPRNVVVCERSHAEDVRSCRVQILQHRDVIAHVDLQYGELVSQSGADVRREFVDMDENPCGCFLNATVSKSTTYGVEDSMSL